MALQQPGQTQPQQMSAGQQGQHGQQTRQGQQMEASLEQAVPQEMLQALQQFNQAAKVCEWCADRCTGEGQEMAECLRLCRDVADVASLNARFIARDSSFGPDLAQLFISVAEECARECSQHSHGHCQDCARVLRQASQSTQRLLQSLQSSSGTGAQATGMQPQSMSGQSSQGMPSQGMQTQRSRF
jgi:hypothetical protein